MKTDEVKLSQVKLNAENPRIITSDKLQKLINSLIAFPKMLDIRPVVVDGTMVALGGNMRINALKEIAKMTPQQLGERLASLADYVNKTDGEKNLLIDYWGAWLENPKVEIIRANELTEDERKQFIIKDNLSFGQWDYDMLANEWDTDMLGDWGFDTNLLHASESEWDKLPIVDKNIEAPSLDKSVRIEITIPKELADAADEIRESIEQVLITYDGVTIK